MDKGGSNRNSEENLHGDLFSKVFPIEFVAGIAQLQGKEKEKRIPSKFLSYITESIELPFNKIEENQYRVGLGGTGWKLSFIRSSNREVEHESTSQKRYTEMDNLGDVSLLLKFKAMSYRSPRKGVRAWASMKLALRYSTKMTNE